MSDFADTIRDALPTEDTLLRRHDAYFSADVETDGPIPGPYSMLSFALVFAGTFDGKDFHRPTDAPHVYAELKPISDDFQRDALRVNQLNRQRLALEGTDPEVAMTEAAEWVRGVSRGLRPILVAYPLSFDWTWLYWYFIRYSRVGSPFNHSGCFDIKTAFAVKSGRPIAQSGRDEMPSTLLSGTPHRHHALDDAREQAEIFAKLFEWSGR